MDLLFSKISRSSEGMLRQALQVQVVARLMESCLSRKAAYIDSIKSINVSLRANTSSGAYANTASPSSLEMIMVGWNRLTNNSSSSERISCECSSSVLATNDV